MDPSKESPKKFISLKRKADVLSHPSESFQSESAVVDGIGVDNHIESPSPFNEYAPQNKVARLDGDALPGAIDPSLVEEERFVVNVDNVSVSLMVTQVYARFRTCIATAVQYEEVDDPNYGKTCDQCGMDIYSWFTAAPLKTGRVCSGCYRDPKLWIKTIQIWFLRDFLPCYMNDAEFRQGFYTMLSTEDFLSKVDATSTNGDADEEYSVEMDRPLFFFADVVRYQRLHE